jgi:DNA-binding NtrC family response regulator
MRHAPVLIVSSDLDTQDLYVSALRANRRATHSVATLDELLAFTRAMTVAAIVVDIRHETDWDVCAAVRQHDGAHAIPVVVISGYVAADGCYRRRAAQYGCAAFMAKPALPADLNLTIDRVLSGEHGIEVMSPGAASEGGLGSRAQSSRR